MKKSTILKDRKQADTRKADMMKFGNMLGALEKKIPSGASFAPGTCIRIYCRP